MANTVERTRVKCKKGKKIKLCFGYSLTAIYMYVAYGNGVTISYNETDKKEVDRAVKTLKLLYKLLDSEIPQIERKLKITIDEEGIYSKDGKNITKIEL